jgi:DDE_Tnp_1-associated
MKHNVPESSLLGQLQKVPDPRRREGQIYAHWSILGLLIVGALHGEGSLRGMGLRGVKEWALISRPLGFVGNARPPSYGTVWYLVSRLDVAGVEQAIEQWVESWVESEVLSLDGKKLRGSKRSHPAQSALEVVTAVAQGIKVVVGQQAIGEEGETAAVLALLHSVPLAGKIVTADAGLLDRAMVKAVLAGGGDYLGLLKDNQPEVKQALDEWMKADLFPPGTGTPRR